MVRLEGALASIAFFKECEVGSEAQVLFNKSLQDEHLGGSDSREERPGKLRSERT